MDLQCIYNVFAIGNPSLLHFHFVESNSISSANQYSSIWTKKFFLKIIVLTQYVCDECTPSLVRGGVFHFIYFVF